MDIKSLHSFDLINLKISSKRNVFLCLSWSVFGFDSTNATLCTLKGYGATLERYKSMKGFLAVVLMTCKQILVLACHIYIVVSLCSLIVKKLSCQWAMVLFPSCSGLLNTWPGFYCLVSEHLAANKRARLPWFLACVFKERTHLIYNES